MHKLENKNYGKEEMSYNGETWYMVEYMKSETNTGHVLLVLPIQMLQIIYATFF